MCRFTPRRTFARCWSRGASWCGLGQVSTLFFGDSGWRLINHLALGEMNGTDERFDSPDTSTTSIKSGLPAGRKLKVYGFAPPATMDRHLGKLATKICHSFCYSSDAVPRFSLGHIRDIRSAVLALCRANDDPDESCNRILKRILAYQAGSWGNDEAGKLGELQWVRRALQRFYVDFVLIFCDAV